MPRRFVASLGYRDLRPGPHGTISMGAHKGLPDIRSGGGGDISTFFLGPRAENANLFSELVGMAVDAVVDYRRYYHPEDPPHITEQIKVSPEYLAGAQILRDKFNLLLQKLSRYTTPYFSMRYQGHMLRDNTIPGMLGFFATMMHNPNNVTVQASTLTTFLEMAVGEDLCAMLGFDGNVVEPWAHLTADGTVANLEASWAARELKYLPAAIRYALLNDPNLEKADGLEVALLDGSHKELVMLGTWQVLNLKMNEILALPAKVAKLLGSNNPAGLSDEASVWSYLLGNYSVNSMGWLKFYSACLDGFSSGAVILAPRTKHYSWPKAAAILGLGTNAGAIDIEVDERARMDVGSLRKHLDLALENQQPVLMTVAVMGSTEETAVDPLSDVLAIREEYRARGLEFVVHADGAWGGYFVSTMRKDFDQPPVRFDQVDEGLSRWDKHPFLTDISGVHLNEHTKKHMMRIRDCDSVTIDPHKCGYVQYPAGAICYRNTEYKNLLTFGAPVIETPGSDPGVGIYGVEGSRPGACAAGVFLSHAVIRPSASGYGKLLNRVLFNTKLFYLHVLSLARPDDPFVVVPLAPLPAGRDVDAAVLLDRIRKEGAGKIPHDLLSLFNELGPDQNIVDYVFNLREPNGSINSDLDLLNKLNGGIYDRLHVIPGDDVEKYDLMITQTQMSTGDYGQRFMDAYLRRLGVSSPGKLAYTLNVNRSVIMDPWSGETPVGHGDFFNVIFGVLRKTVIDVVKEIKHHPKQEAAASV